MILARVITSKDGVFVVLTVILLSTQYKSVDRSLSTNQSSCIFWLLDSSGEATETDWEINIH